MILALPGLAYHFGLLPHHLDEMTAPEIDVFLEALDQLARQAATDEPRVPAHAPRLRG